ncbi:MAG TPA: hypothetical protein VK152_05820 [Paludibacter sp.]|nr:hypothetical protein [Paludibacter sp.]
MKKIILSLVLALGVAGALNAQVNGKAIGLRFGGVGELSYQHPLSDKNRVELDLGFGYWGSNLSGTGYGRLGLTGIYHWVFDLSSVTDGLNWYVGPGAVAGLSYGSYYTNSAFVGIAGQIGAEYNFSFPLQLSLDYRPVIFLVKPGWMSYGAYDGVCLAVRYKF